jgi:hypothetical protein
VALRTIKQINKNINNRIVTHTFVFEANVNFVAAEDEL